MSLYISTNFSCLKIYRSVDNNYYFYQNIPSLFKINISSFETINNKIKQLNIGKKYYVHPKLNCVSEFSNNKSNIKSTRETRLQAGYIRHSSYGDILYSPVSRYFNHIQQIVIYSLFSINTAMLFEYHNIKYMKEEEVFPMSSRIFLKEFIPQILQNNHLNISLDIIMSTTVFDELQRIQKNIKNYQPLDITNNITFGTIPFDLEKGIENISLETLFINYFQYYTRIYQTLKDNIVFILLTFLTLETIKKIQNINITDDNTIQLQKVRLNLEKLKIYYFSDFNIFILKCKISILFERSIINSVHLLSIIHKDNTHLYYEYKITNLNFFPNKKQEYKEIIKIPSQTVIHLPKTIDQNQEIKYTLQDIYNYLVQEVHKSNTKNTKKRSKKS